MLSSLAASTAAPTRVAKLGARAGSRRAQVRFFCTLNLFVNDLRCDPAPWPPASRRRPTGGGRQQTWSGARNSVCPCDQHCSRLHGRFHDLS